MTKAYELHPHIFLSDWTNPNVALVKGKGMQSMGCQRKRIPGLLLRRLQRFIGIWT